MPKSTDFGYFSHFPILAAALARTNGPILECGAGLGSTPMIHYASGGKRFILTLDSDSLWASEFEGYARDWHCLAKAENWRIAIETLPDNPWGLAFIDCAPGEVRKEIILSLKDKARIILAHDSEKDYNSGGNYGYEEIIPQFKYVSEFRRFRPYTLIFSNYEEFEIEPCDQNWKPE